MISTTGTFLILRSSLRQCPSLLHRLEDPPGRGEWVDGGVRVVREIRLAGVNGVWGKVGLG